MQPVKVKENIWWVGGIDWDLRNFHGYITQKGSSYNSYLIIDEKITLIDTVKHYLFNEMIERISKIIDPKKIDIIISNHVEMDHSGGLPELMKLCPNATIICSPKGEEGLKAHYKKEWGFKVVKSGNSINIGKRTLQFVNTPMVHWPDNMVTYCPEEKILFSNDGMGQHIASYERFDYEYTLDIILEEAKKYYANIVLPYDSMVRKELEAASTLDIEIIAPSHGIIWTSNIPKIIEEYKKWSNNEVKNKAVIIYDTMWHSTEKIAYAIYRAFDEKGITVELCNLQLIHISDIMTKVIDSKYICIGSPTLNNNILPTVSAFLTYFKGLSPKNRIGLAFGSYGWGGQSVGHVEDILKELKFEIMEQIKIKYIPDEKSLNEITKKISSILK
jgi:flavorubredoxin